MLLKTLAYVSVVLFAATPLHAHEPSVGKNSGARSTRGAASGTTFWSGPAYRGDKPLRYGSAHPRDWVGSPDTEYFALEDVVITAHTVDDTSANARRPAGTASDANDSRSWPNATPALMECWETIPCTRVLVLRGDSFLISNHRKVPLILHLLQNEREQRTLEIGANREEVVIDIKDLHKGVYRLEEPTPGAPISWAYRVVGTPPVVGPTNGNCRFNLSLSPGNYRLVAWHPHLTATEQRVSVRAGIITRANLVFSQQNVAP